MRTGGTAAEWKVIPLAPAATDVFKSPDPENVSLGSPSIVAFPGGRILVSMDLAGSGVKHLPGTKGRAPSSGFWLQGKVFVSSDKGKTWTCKLDFPFHQAQLFRVGSALYLMGLAGDFRIMKSVDGGETWSRTSDLALGDGEYAQTPGSVLCRKDHVYVVVMKHVGKGNKDDFPHSYAPVVLHARQGADLTSRKSWSCSEPGKPFHEMVPREGLDYFGVPFLPMTAPAPSGKPQKSAGRQWTDRLGWDSPHIVEIKDPNHCWHDPRGRTLHILTRLDTHRSNLAVVVKVVEDDAGRMTMDLESTPGGTRMAFVPLPGGNLKYDITYDEESRLYWLASNLTSDSMARVDNRPPGRIGPSGDDRQRLQLHFSRNLVDWCFAGYVESGSAAKQWRHSCSMAIGGSDLVIACCSGQPKFGIREYTDRITFHPIPGFRELVY